MLFSAEHCLNHVFGHPAALKGLLVFGPYAGCGAELVSASWALPIMNPDLYAFTRLGFCCSPFFDYVIHVAAAYSPAFGTHCLFS